MTIYLDNAATTRISAPALIAMDAIYKNQAFANPASVHSAGDRALHELEDARKSVARCLGARSSEVIFTSGGSEANNQALLTGAAFGARTGRRHMVISAIEHPSVLNYAAWLASADGPYGGNFEIEYVRPQANGVFDVASVRDAIREDTCLVSIMSANNEVGSVQPVHDICRAAQKRGALFHTDAVQAAGHIELNFTDAEFDLMSISAHKFHGPRGIGALLCSHRIKPATFMYGGSQERGHRAGTVNVAGAVGMAAALEQACANIKQNTQTTEQLRAQFIAGISQIEGLHVLGPEAPEAEIDGVLSTQRLAGIVGFTTEGISREAALVLLDEQGLCVSAGSACAAGAAEESSTLAAMGIGPDQANGYLRISIDAQENTPEQIDTVVEILKNVISTLRRDSHE